MVEFFKFRSFFQHFELSFLTDQSSVNKRQEKSVTDYCISHYTGKVYSDLIQGDWKVILDHLWHKIDED